MKITYELNSKDYEDDLDTFYHHKKAHEKAIDNQIILDHLDAEIFRPFFKYGYTDSKLNSLYQKIKDNEDVVDFMDELRTLFNFHING